MFDDKKLREEVYHPITGILAQAKAYADGIVGTAKELAVGEAQRLCELARQYVDTQIRGLDTKVQKLAGDVREVEKVVDGFRTGIVAEAGQCAKTAVDNAVGTYFLTHGLTVTEGKEVDLDALLVKTQAAMHDPLREKVLKACKDNGLRAGDSWNGQYNDQVTRELEGLTLRVTGYSHIGSKPLDQREYSSERMLSDFTRSNTPTFDYRPANINIHLNADFGGNYGNTSFALELLSLTGHVFLDEQKEDQLQQLEKDMLCAMFTGVASRYIKDRTGPNVNPLNFLPTIATAINNLRKNGLHDNAILNAFAAELIGQYGVMAQYLRPLEQTAAPTV